MIVDIRLGTTRSITAKFNKMHSTAGTSSSQVAESNQPVYVTPVHVTPVHATQTEIMSLRKQLEKAQSEVNKAKTDAANRERERTNADRYQKELEKDILKARNENHVVENKLKALTTKLEKVNDFNVKAKQSIVELVSNMHFMYAYYFNPLTFFL